MERKEIIEWLYHHAEKEYQKFSLRLIPDCDNLIGVRLPILRKKAKEIARTNWKEFLSEYGLLAICDKKEENKIKEKEFFEEIQLQGMVIGYLKIEIEELLTITKAFIPKITNWSLNDSFCSGFQVAKKYPDRVWEFFINYQESKSEFELRMLVVMLMNYYFTNDYFDKSLAILQSLKHDGYYFKMGVAWALSIAYSKDKKKVISLLENHSLDDFICQKALQKMIESKQITKEEKEILRKKKRNLYKSEEKEKI